MATSATIALHLNTRILGDVAVIVPSGRIVAGEAVNTLHAHATRILLEHNEIVLHLGEVSFIDSSGLGMLARLLASCRRKSGDLKLCSATGVVRQALQLTNLLKLFDSYDSEEEAITAFFQGMRRAAADVDYAAVSLLCVDESPDVLACMREVLGGAGYKALTSSNIHDALILMRAAKPRLVLLGPRMLQRHGQPTRERFAAIDPKVSVLILHSEFATQDAGDAAKGLLEAVRFHLH
jgi:anti-sigma B factor antagonist